MNNKTKDILRERAIDLALVFTLVSSVALRVHMNNNAALDFVNVKDKNGIEVFNDLALRTNESLTSIQGDKTLTVTNTANNHQENFTTKDGYSWKIAKDSVNFNEYYEQHPEIEKPGYP